ncbi:MAG: YHS domain-containing protein [Anaerolineae bacterium CG_4_9_14_3_um_filter_57_17]|nr:MAG: YHS domain-containing protein [Anaerolineae bacterium CG_4_9_14_3_um_filter_57_17]
MVKDPVCGMAVNPQNAAASIKYKGQTYYFCSALCTIMFEREPEKYVNAGQAMKPE